MTNKPIEIAVVGVGHRADIYAAYALSHPDRMKVVAVADPDANRRAQFSLKHNLPPSAEFESYQALAAQPRLADAVINGTMDKMHVPSSLPFLERGYHLLLEKPISPSEAEMMLLQKTAHANNVTVMICHVLRYAPFYAAIKEAVASGVIGEIVSIHTAENVCYHHMAVGFVRGKWNKKAEQTPMLLAKCCHDLDIIAWLMSGTKAERVASFGSLKIFKPENAPPGSALRCLNGCEIEPTCAYSAKANYVDANLWGYAWEPIEHIPNPTREQKLESLRVDNPYGRCVWHCDNDVVDHQTVIIEFEGGATATHNMFGATAKPGRDIHIIGTTGELQGDLEEMKLVLRRPDPSEGKRQLNAYSQQEVPIDMPVGADGGPLGHGGGDMRLIADFISVLRGETTSKGVSRLEDSLTGHRIAFAAETARLEKRVVELENL